MSDSGMAGQIGLTDTNHHVNMHHFAMRQLQARMRTNVLVKVVAVYPGQYPHSWMVDVQPLVNQVDGGGQSQAHGTVYGIPMVSGSGGNGAIIVKPKKGDMGLMAIGDRDHSAAVAANGAANPGSARMHDFADGLYMGGFQNQNNASHWIVADENGFTVQGDLTITGSVKATGEVIAKTGTSGGVHLSTHVHSGVTPGSGNTAAPVSGS